MAQRLAEAERLQAAKDPQAARRAFEEAVAAAEAAGLIPEEARAREGLAGILLDAGSFADARTQAARAAALLEKVGDRQRLARARRTEAHALESLGDLAAAAIAFTAAREASISINDARGRAMATLGLLYVKRGDFAHDAPLYEATIRDARQAGDKSLQARATHSWGDRLFNEENYAASLTQLREAERVFTEIGDDVARGTVYNSMGRLYRAHGQLSIALEYQLKALALHEQGRQPFFHMQSLNAVAVTYESLGDQRSAREYFTRALAMAETVASPRVQDFLRANIAGSATETDDLAAAASVLEGVLARGLDTFPAVRWLQLSYLYDRLKRPEDALRAAERAVELCGRPDGRDCVIALAQRAHTRYTLGNAAVARQDLATALEALDTARSRLVPVDFLKQRFHHARESVYSSAVTVHFEDQGGRTALEMAEMARARSFLDLLATRESAAAAAAPAAAPDLAPAAGAKSLPWLDNTGTAAAATVPEIAATAKRLGSTFLFYWVSQDRLFIWVVGADGVVAAREVTVSSGRLADLVRATTPGASSPSRRRGEPAVPSTPDTSSAVRSRNAWRELYRLLIAPVAADLPRQTGALLTVVPHGPLTSLAFAALQARDGTYLIERFTLHYVPAAGVLQYTGARANQPTTPGRLLLVADPVPPKQGPLDTALPRLPGSRAEVRGIAALLGKRRAETLEDRAATEAAIRPALSGKDVLHFATHAVVRDDQPFSSFLALGATGAGEAADGYLTAAEIYGLRLDARLVVLTACRSAGGRVIGDGLAAFARAFIYAGTPSIIASVWDVADQPTDALVPAFYRRWIGGMSIASALRGAQLELLRNLRAGKVRMTTAAGDVAVAETPMLWAGFMLVGEPR